MHTSVNNSHEVIKKRTHTHDTCDLSHLEEHSDDGHHCQPSVRQLRRKFFGLLSRVAGGQDLEAEVARCGCGASRLILGNPECHVGKDLSPTCGRNFRDRCKTIWHVSELQPGGRRKAGNLPVILGCLNRCLSSAKRAELTRPNHIKHQRCARNVVRENAGRSDISSPPLVISYLINTATLQTKLLRSNVAHCRKHRLGFENTPTYTKLHQ